MRRFVVFIPLVLFFGLGILLWRGLQLDPSELPSALIDKPMPTFSLPSLQTPDKTLTEQDLKFGEPVLLNVWATWCPSCKAEHAQLNRIAEQGVKIVGINYKDDRGKAKVWLEKYLNPYMVNIYDEKGTLGLDLGVYGAPETYVIDAQGVIRYKHVGVVDARVWQQLEAIIAKLNNGEAS
ncbi:MAG: DsbE family thiol:disulfide interchange protein [Marinobacterium sp.]|nr:DsbE family thiol:disulfide interchange protein [Marinobacterium sp.]